MFFVDSQLSQGPFLVKIKNKNVCFFLFNFKKKKSFFFFFWGGGGYVSLTQRALAAEVFGFS